ncbi:MAG: hypothetical protein NTZ32_06665 [Planctomycetales bacterium]|nr:hypothetical protein [Planctomycetales bacterium]
MATFLCPFCSPASQKSLFRRAVARQHAEKVFFEPSASASALEPPCPARRGSPARRKSLFQVDFGRQRHKKDFSNTPQPASDLEKSFPTHQNRPTGGN